MLLFSTKKKLCKIADSNWTSNLAQRLKNYTQENISIWGLIVRMELRLLKSTTCLCTVQNDFSTRKPLSACSSVKLILMRGKSCCCITGICTRTLGAGPLLYVHMWSIQVDCGSLGLKVCLNVLKKPFNEQNLESQTESRPSSPALSLRGLPSCLEKFSLRLMQCRGMTHLSLLLRSFGLSGCR